MRRLRKNLGLTLLQLAALCNGAPQWHTMLARELALIEAGLRDPMFSSARRILDELKRQGYAEQIEQHYRWLRKRGAVR